MVDQAQVNPTNGRTELPPRAVARSTADFLHDVATLAELQGKLALVDLREGMQKLLFPVGLLGVGAAVALGCVPIALMAIAFTLEATTDLPVAACFGISLAIGLVLAAIIIGAAIAGFKKNIRIFDRSLAEWRCNSQWAKDTLKRLGKNPNDPYCPVEKPYSGRW
jgi:hypothetical protein